MGVKRQYSGALGQTGNCRVGVLVGLLDERVDAAIVIPVVRRGFIRSRRSLFSYVFLERNIARPSRSQTGSNIFLLT